MADSQAQLLCLSSLKDYGLDIIPTLPLPLGIIGSNDKQARKVLEMLNQQEWDIPGQIAVMGMDNDQLCEISEIPITSVAIDPLRWGKCALDTMLAMIHDGTVPPDIQWIPPLGVVERESCAQPCGDGAVMATVLELIKQDRALSWTVQDLALQAGASRATLVRHCRDSLGTTPHELLHQIRLHKAEMLLRDSSQTISAIAKRCGWQSPKTLFNAFEKAHGMSPSAYRNLQGQR